ncbi:MAG: His/Gly/Thr/Pro-type tRNA ligase C-terminal domain-containing protein, partial [Verrucomicrobiota bacterium]
IAACHALADSLRQQIHHGEALRVHVDTRDLSGGVKKWEWIKKGVPIRIEIGPRDLETQKVCVQRRDQPVAAKEFAAQADFLAAATSILDAIHLTLLERATALRDSNITSCGSLDAFHAHWAQDNPGWLHTAWAGTPEQEEELSKQHKIAIRCIPLATASLPPQLMAGSSDKCILTGAATATRALWGRSY